MRAQVSFEYLIIAGIAMLLITPTFYLLYKHSQDSSSQVIAARMERFGSEILKQSKSMYYTGRYAKTSIDFEMPNRVSNLTIQGKRELVIIIDTPQGNHSMLYYSDVPIQTGPCSAPVNFSESFFNPGKKSLIVESCGDNVSLYST